jgi:tRNA(adenine34) deaminase
MGEALDEASAALAHGDVPVGAVVLRDGEVIAARHNERELTGDPTAHAEMLALRDAATVVGGWRLDGCTLVVTLEPCPMCAGAVVAARIPRVVIGAPDLEGGAALSLYNVCDDPRLNHQAEVIVGVEAEASAGLLRNFFAGRR